VCESVENAAHFDVSAFTPGRRVLWDDAEDIGDWSVMEFRLTYEGPLQGATQDKTLNKHKHEIESSSTLS
jgi:hypothetical protein